MRLKRCSLHKRWQTEFRMSSLNSLNLACVGELVVSTMEKLHQKQMVVSLSVERLNVASSAESLQYCWCWGQEVKDETKMEPEKNDFLHSLTSHILSAIFNYSCRVFVCVLCICVYVCLSLCHCVQRTCISVCAFPVEATSRILAWGLLPIRTWRSEQMDLSEVCSQLGVPCFKPATSTPPHSHPHPSDHFIHQCQLCTTSAISSKQMVILLW